MSAYNFQREFAPKIRSGEKRCTIRLRRKNGYVPRPGERIRLYAGMRTRQCVLLREVDVLRVRPIQINQELNRLKEVEELAVVLEADRLTPPTNTRTREGRRL